MMDERAGTKSAAAFRTIGEVSRETGLPQHILRYWETRFPQLRPLTRAGNRRYYRREDLDLVRRIDALLNHEGYTIRGVQQLLAAGAAAPSIAAEAVARTVPSPPVQPASDVTAQLRVLRDHLAHALTADRG